MGDSWETMTVEQISDPRPRSIAIGPFGSRMKADRYVSVGVPVIRGLNISDTRTFRGEFVYVSDGTADELAACNVFADDLVFPHRGAIGLVGIVPSDANNRYMLSTSLMKLTCDTSKVDPRFLYYFFRSSGGRNALLAHASTVGTPGIGQPLASLRGVRVPVPPLDEQRKVSAILGTLDDKIELNRRMSETLEAMARALFKSWFVDFDPVRAKAEGRDTGLPKEVADLFPDSFEDSELGEIPKGWGASTLEAMALLNPESWTRGTLPDLIEYVDLTNTKGGRIEAVTQHHRDGSPSRARRVLRRGDTIVGTVRPGNGSFALVQDDGLTGSTGFAVLRPREKEWSSYVYLAATADTNLDSLAHLADGGAYPAVNPEAVSATPIVQPHDDILLQFGRITTPLLARVAANDRAARTTGALRDTLLPELIAGRTRLEACPVQREASVYGAD